MEQQPSTNRPERRMPPGGGLAIGVGVGVALGAALNNLAVGIAIGAGIGVILDQANARRNRREQ